MVDGGAAGDGQAIGLGPADRLETSCRRDHGKVQPSTRITQDVQVAVDAEEFGLPRVAGEAEGGAHLAFMHDAVRLEPRIVRIREYGHSCRLVVLQCAAEHFRTVNGTVV